MRPSLLIVILVLALFLASLLLPAFDCGSHDKSFLGLAVLAIGWAGLLGLDPRWFANPILLIMLWRLASDKVDSKQRLPVAAVLLALAALPFRAPGCEGGGGAPGMSIALGIGGYVWVAAIVVGSGAYLLRSISMRMQVPRKAG